MLLSILQMGKLRHREARSPAQLAGPAGRGPGVSPTCYKAYYSRQLPSLICFCLSPLPTTGAFFVMFPTPSPQGMGACWPPSGWCLDVSLSVQELIHDVLVSERGERRGWAEALCPFQPLGSGLPPLAPLSQLPPRHAALSPQEHSQTLCSQGPGDTLSLSQTAYPVPS